MKWMMMSMIIEMGRRRANTCYTAVDVVLLFRLPIERRICISCTRCCGSRERMMGDWLLMTCH